MPDVFISYNREDRDTAREVATGLEAEGFSVWYDAALRAGEDHEEVTETNLRSAGAVVVLWSKRSTSSKWVRAEATVGERSSTLVPALIEECDRPVRFELLQTADLTRWHGDRNDANWRDFVNDVRAAITRRNGAPAAAQTAAQTQAPAPSSTKASDNSVNIETTFWNSIKDGSERADFEAYIARYPRGHFADLARNRIASIDRVSRAAAAAKPQPQPAAAARPAPTQAAAQPAARAAPKPAPAPAAKPKGAGGAIMIAGGVAALAAAGVAGFFLMRSNSGAASAVNAEPAAQVAAAAPVDPAAATASGVAMEPPSEPATDALADAAVAIEGETVTAPADPAGSLALPEPEALPAKPASTTAPATTGSTARDCDSCPLMAALPGGVYQMGSPEGESGRNPYEGPQHEVTVKPFRIGVYEVTVGEWGQCVADGACQAKPASDANLPVLRVSWNEAKAYARWLSGKAGKKYRLPTESEWEYAARGGTGSPWHWGASFDAGKVARGEAKPVGSFDPNAFGLHDMLSNAREWAEDCYNNNFTQTPRDGSAASNGDCSVRVVRGGGFASGSADTRVANRIRNKPGDQIRYMGFRVAAEAP